MRKAVLFMLLVSLFGPLQGRAQGLAWAAVKQQIRSTFPDVRQLSTDSLAARLDRHDAPLLLDVRTEDEYAVSHLPGARRLDPQATTFDALADVPKSALIVTYCSVGYRSSEMGRRLQEAGFTNVANLEGSIFQWANEGRPVVRDGTPVRQVHPYDALWGTLLDKELRAYHPEP